MTSLPAPQSDCHIWKQAPVTTKDFQNNVQRRHSWYSVSLAISAHQSQNLCEYVTFVSASGIYFYISILYAHFFKRSTLSEYGINQFQNCRFLTISLPHLIFTKRHNSYVLTGKYEAWLGKCFKKIINQDRFLLDVNLQTLGNFTFLNGLKQCQCIFIDI